ncbi:ATP-binding cassette domain-containing protein [Oceanispirochaeta sp. M1]|uniref:ATP-binding cassette domain-containing protein n=1 Tax=Oceanispirochaeta sp. M1 TaxID=2283433 RepID=UPI000E098A42|nr:ATP-binding cassette domain-containing protein [Oceanispirochaeta sp. M1]NPD70689.1 ATP-binding cassette domain-containing protein [Oceanispirochaeta sp. M1]RDG34449.1 ATP-binding cassette domain-containing protein [Oceanispirochaeta sp. M1]
MDSPLLEMRNIRFNYGHVPALKGIDFDLYPGEIHALTGDHGSGKTSLVKILSGSLLLQGGSIRVNGQSFYGFNPSASVQQGIGMVYQSETLIPSGTLFDNVYLGRFPQFIFSRRRKELLKHCQELFDIYGFDEDPMTRVTALSPARRQVLSFLRVLAQEAKILILDEIAQKTTPEEQQHIYRMLRMCRAQNKGIIYVSSNIDEIFRISDRVTILKDGHRRGTEEVSRVDRTRLVNLAFSFAIDRDESPTQVDHEVLLMSRYDQRIINDIPQGLIIISPNDEIQDLNTAASRILECDPVEIKGQPLNEYFRDLQLEKLDEIEKVIVERKAGLWQKLKFVRNKLLKIRVSPLGEEGDSRHGMLVFLEDISSDYETKEYLQQAEKFVSTAEMAAGVAHEVNNPLGIIQNYLDLMQLDELPENSQDCVQHIQSELTRIVEIISSLLSFSRVGVRPIKSLDLHLLLDEVSILMGHKFKERKITLEKDYRSGQILLDAHENKLKQLFLNLLSNALEAVLKGGKIIVRTSLCQSAEGVPQAVISFIDNGHGIPGEILDQIFSPFYSTKMTKTNTGLGLSICQHIAESYNGKITAESIPGENTSFLVYLPLTQGQD